MAASWHKLCLLVSYRRGFKRKRDTRPRLWGPEEDGGLRQEGDGLILGFVIPRDANWLPWPRIEEQKEKRRGDFRRSLILFVREPCVFERAVSVRKMELYSLKKSGKERGFKYGIRGCGGVERRNTERVKRVVE